MAHCTLQDNLVSVALIFSAKFGECFKIQLSYFNILPQQNFKGMFSKLTHSPKCQNVLHDNTIMDVSPSLGVYHISIYMFVLQDQTGVSMRHESKLTFITLMCVKCLFLMMSLFRMSAEESLLL